MMKQTRFFFAALMCLLMQSAYVMADDVVIDASQLPETAKTFIAKQFTDCKIKKVEKDLGSKTSFDVKLSRGIEIEFNAQGDWKKLDCGRHAVPADLVPAAIGEYVKQNHPKAVVTGIERKCYGYEIDLSRGPDLLFDQKGSFIGADR